MWCVGDVWLEGWRVGESELCLCMCLCSEVCGGIRGSELCVCVLGGLGGSEPCVCSEVCGEGRGVRAVCVCVLGG